MHDRGQMEDRIYILPGFFFGCFFFLLKGMSKESSIDKSCFNMRCGGD